MQQKREWATKEDQLATIPKPKGGRCQCQDRPFGELTSSKELDFKELDFKELGVLGYLLGVLGYLLGVPMNGKVGAICRPPAANCTSRILRRMGVTI